LSAQLSFGLWSLWRACGCPENEQRPCLRSKTPSRWLGSLNSPRLVERAIAPSDTAALRTGGPACASGPSAGASGVAAAANVGGSSGVVRAAIRSSCTHRVVDAARTGGLSAGLTGRSTASPKRTWPPQPLAERPFREDGCRQLGCAWAHP
jgi:hypothetical protein